MAVNRAEVVNRNFLESVEHWQPDRAKPPARRSLDKVAAGSGGADPVTGRMLVELFESQITCRQLDLVAREVQLAQRELRAEGKTPVAI